MKESRPKNFIVSSVLPRDMDPDLFCKDTVGVSSVRFSNTKETMDPGELADR